MPRPIHEIVTHVRMVIASPQVSTTLIQTEDLEVLCSAVDALVTARMFIQNQSIAHALVIQEGAEEKGWPTLLQVIDGALGDEQKEPR